MKHIVLRVVLGCVLLTLAGCGFHLRGQADVPDALKTLYVKGINTQQDDFGRTLKRALVRNGVVVLNDYQQGVGVLTILENRYQRHVLSVGTDAKVREYEMEVTVRFKVTDQDGKPLGQAQKLEARRDYQFDRDQVIAMEEQERVLREELNKQLAQGVLRRLSALK